MKTMKIAIQGGCVVGVEGVPGVELSVAYYDQDPPRVDRYEPSEPDPDLCADLKETRAAEAVLRQAFKAIAGINCSQIELSDPLSKAMLAVMAATTATVARRRELQIALIDGGE